MTSWSQRFWGRAEPEFSITVYLLFFASRIREERPSGNFSKYSRHHCHHTFDMPLIGSVGAERVANPKTWIAPPRTLQRSVIPRKWHIHQHAPLLVQKVVVGSVEPGAKTMAFLTFPTLACMAGLIAEMCAWPLGRVSLYRQETVQRYPAFVGHTVFQERVPASGTRSALENSCRRLASEAFNFNSTAYWCFPLPHLFLCR